MADLRGLLKLVDLLFNKLFKKSQFVVDSLGFKLRKMKADKWEGGGKKNPRAAPANCLNLTFGKAYKNLPCNIGV